MLSCRTTRKHRATQRRRVERRESTGSPTLTCRLTQRHKHKAPNDREPMPPYRTTRKARGPKHRRVQRQAGQGTSLGLDANAKAHALKDTKARGNNPNAHVYSTRRRDTKAKGNQHLRVERHDDKGRELEQSRLALLWFLFSLYCLVMQLDTTNPRRLPLLGEQYINFL
jgi:hypothetical protein